MNNYTLLDLGFDYLPYWDDETDSDNTENEQSTETTDINIDLPF